jgi:hypothetical protein
MDEKFENMTLGEIYRLANSGDSAAEAAVSEMRAKSQRFQDQLDADHERRMEELRELGEAGERAALVRERREKAMFVMTAIASIAAVVAVVIAVIALVV